MLSTYTHIYYFIGTIIWHKKSPDSYFYIIGCVLLDEKVL